MKRKINENIEHRGNDQNITSKLLLEMQLLSNLNKEYPVYSFDDQEKSDKKNKF